MAKLAARYSIPFQPEVIEPVVEVRPEYLQAAFDSIRTAYGDMDRYLREALDFDASAKAELKARLLI
jgi:protein-tyrosine phosphatase